MRAHDLPPFAPAGFSMCPADCADVARLAVELGRGHVALFVGAGLSRCAESVSARSTRPPLLWDELNQAILDRIGLPENDREHACRWSAPRVAGLYAELHGRERLLALLGELVDTASFRPGRVHHRLARMRWSAIITTNYDDLIERAFEETGNPADLISEDSMVRPRRRGPRVLKMNGCLRHGDPNRLVITEEDFRRYGEERPLVELFVKKTFLDSHVLFLGFGLTDPAFQQVFGWVRDHLRGPERRVYSVQWCTSEAERRYWASQQINILDVHPTEIACNSCDGNRTCDRDRAFEPRLYELLEWMAKEAVERPRRAPQLQTPARPQANLVSAGGADIPPPTHVADAAVGVSARGPDILPLTPSPPDWQSALRWLLPILGLHDPETAGEPLESEATASELGPSDEHGARGRDDLGGMRMEAFFAPWAANLPSQTNPDDSAEARLVLEVARGKWWADLTTIKRLAERLTRERDTPEEARGFFLLEDFGVAGDSSDPYRHERWSELLPRIVDDAPPPSADGLPGQNWSSKAIQEKLLGALRAVCAGRQPLGNHIRGRLVEILTEIEYWKKGPAPAAIADRERTRLECTLCVLYVLAMAGDLLCSEPARAALRALDRRGLLDRAGVLRWAWTAFEKGLAARRFIPPAGRDDRLSRQAPQNLPRPVRERVNCAWLWMEGLETLVRVIAPRLDEEELELATELATAFMQRLDEPVWLARWTRVGAELSRLRGGRAGRPSVRLVSALRAQEQQILAMAERRPLPELSMSRRWWTTDDVVPPEIAEPLLAAAVRRHGRTAARDVWVWAWRVGRRMAEGAAGGSNATPAAAHPCTARDLTACVREWTGKLLGTGFFQGAGWLDLVAQIYATGFAAHLGEEERGRAHAAVCAFVNEVIQGEGGTYYREWRDHFGAWVELLAPLLEDLGWARLAAFITPRLAELPWERHDGASPGVPWTDALCRSQELDARLDFVLLATRREETVAPAALRVMEALIEKGAVGRTGSPYARLARKPKARAKLVCNALERWNSSSPYSLADAARCAVPLLAEVEEADGAALEDRLLACVLHPGRVVVPALLECVGRVLSGTAWWERAGHRFLGNLACQLDAPKAEVADAVARFLRGLPPSDERDRRIGEFRDRSPLPGSVSLLFTEDFS